MFEVYNIVFLLFLVNSCRGETIISLDTVKSDVKWTVKNQNTSIVIRANIPGGIYTDLQSAGLLDDELFYRFNDINYRWVAKEKWTYVAEFDLPPEILEKQDINLVFHGIDTVADIFLNGNYLSAVNNMFVRHVIRIKGLAKVSKNLLEVRLSSPIYEAYSLAQIQRESYPVPPECTPEAYSGECHVNFLRKMQASFSWDWGPAFPSVGIWKSVEIEAYDICIIRDIAVTPTKSGDGRWILDTKYYVECAEGIVPTITPLFEIQNAVTGEAVKFRAVYLNGHTRDSTTINGYVFNAQLYIEQEISLWWPNGMANRVLYNMTLCLHSEDGAEFTHKMVTFGFRTIELVQEQLQVGQPGLSFYFKINDVPFFAKGSNWIPAHILPEKGYNETYIRHLLQSAKDANMNMLRVWGGGVYESELFYDIADEMGILIWQDMMFACAMYPTNDDFLNSVKLEIQQQVRRLQHHPSIALWAGNNENEVALRGNWYQTDRNFSLYKEDYIKLYVDTIKPVVEENDKSRAYVTSSPSNGYKSEEEGYVANDPYSPLYGDVHYYNYILDGWSANIYPDTRFASEYGFQSLPSFQSLSKVSLPGDRTLFSEFTKKRQHLPEGNILLINMIEQHISLPFNDGSDEYYKKFIYYSQISQAMSTKTETEKYRRDRDKLTRENRGHTMGAMYWQLNDVWQAPSWSSIEFGGKWKMLHYYARKFFSPVLVSPEWTKTEVVNVFLVSDLLVDVPDVLLTTHVYSWDSFHPKKVYTSRVFLRNNSATIHATYKLDEILEESNCKRKKCFLYFTAVGLNFSSENVLFPFKIDEVENRQTPKLTVSVEETTSRNEAVVRVTTDKIAPFLWLETEEPGEFSDNGFLLLKPDVQLTFRNLDGAPLDFERLKSTIKIESL